MELTSTVSDGKQTIALSGELNTLTSPELSAVFKSISQEAAKRFTNFSMLSRLYWAAL